MSPAERPKPKGDHFRRVRSDLLFLMFLAGCFGAPLVGPLRESLQEVLGLSRLALGLGVFLMGLAAGLSALASVVVLRGRWTRVRFLRVGSFVTGLGMLFLAAVPARPGPAVWLLAFGWFCLLLGAAALGLSNATIVDIYRDRPHQGLILLHGANALGKVFAPLLVLIVGARLSTNAWVFVALVFAVAFRTLTWPRDSTGELERREAGEGPSAESRSARVSPVLFWSAAAQFAFISGSEAGVTSILGSFIATSRPSPIPALDATKWAALVLILLQTGIAVGRFVFVRLSSRTGEARIMSVCLLFTAFVVPGVLLTSPWGYVPSFLLLGIAFSATWPAFFALATRTIAHSRSLFTMATRLFTLIGINFCILLASAVGNLDAGLPVAILVSAAVMMLFALYLFVSPWGRRLRRGG